MRVRSILVAGCLAAGLGLGAAARAEPATPAQEAVFGQHHLDNITEPGTLHYTFRRSGSLLPELVDAIEVDVTGIGPDGRKQIALRLFTGPGQRRVAPDQGFRNNPLIIVFLQRDVEQMSRMTGGSPNYFRNRIRAAFADPRAVRSEEVEVRSRQGELAATKVTLEPFARDPNLARFPEHARKRYEFVIAPELPGGVYSLRAFTPGAAGQAVLDETVTYDGQDS